MENEELEMTTEVTEEMTDKKKKENKSSNIITYYCFNFNFWNTYSCISK